MLPTRTFDTFSGRLVLVGFGSLGQGVLPLVFRHFGVQPEQVTVVTADTQGAEIADALRIRVLIQPLTPENYEAVLTPLLGAGDVLLNVSVHVSSVDLIRLCWKRGALYLDACIEPWAGRYDDRNLPLQQRTNYALREEVLALSRQGRRAPTACVTQGANPGLVSLFVKRALLRMAADLGLSAPMPATDSEWARLAQRLEVKVIHIAERDTQVAAGRRKVRGEFVNTWSVDGFVDEGLQPSELGWGSHERHWPRDAERHGQGCGAAIYLRRPGFATRVRSWTPLEGPFVGFLVTHGESISIADHLTLRDDSGAVSYRPTVHYAYHPCDDAVLSLHELAGREWRLQPAMRIQRDEITAGMDELGVLLMGNPRGVYWYGSRLSIQRARELAPYNSATSLQVVAGLAGAMLWALRNPNAGIVEAEDIDVETVMELAEPYLGDVVGVWGDWTPLAGRRELYPEPADPSDPWQFINFRVD